MTPDPGGGSRRRRPELTVSSNPWLIRLVIVALIVIVALLALALFGGGGSGPGGSPSPASSGVVTAPSVASTRAVNAASARAIAAPPTIAAIPALSPTGATTKATVTRVVDGDTIVVAFGGTTSRVRYIGMDTPESVKPGTPVQPMAKEAAAANRTLVGGRQVLLERDVSETDQYGRLLRDVWVERDGQLVLVGLELVRRGFAQVATFPPDVKYVDQLLAAQRAARAAGIGLWAS